jgi:hypothetical protein
MSDIPITYNIGLPEVQTFKDFGIFENNIDDFGNAQLIYLDSQDDSAKTHYLNFTLKVLSYDEVKIRDNNDVEFTELQSESKTEQIDVEELMMKYTSVLEENKVLNSKVNSLIEQYDATDDKVVIESMQHEIVNLRIQLGQGKMISDFDSSFPFLPLE